MTRTQLLQELRQMRFQEAYARKIPRGTHIARWYCPESHTTFSLLPDCLAARFTGERDTLEAVVEYPTFGWQQAQAEVELRRKPMDARSPPSRGQALRE